MIARLIPLALAICLLIPANAPGPFPAALAASPSATPTAPDEWPMGGANAARTAAIPAAGPAKAPETAWTFASHDTTDYRSLSGTVVWRGLAFVSSDDALFAVDLQTGRLFWRFDGLRELIHQAEAGAHNYVHSAIPGPPAVVDGVIYWGCWIERDENMLPAPLFAIDAQTGQERWRAEMPRGVQSAPVVAQDSVYLRDYTSVVALNAATGAAKWTRETSWSSYEPGLSFARSTLYVGVENNLLALNTADGVVRWTWNAGPGDLCLETAVLDGRVFVATGSMSVGGGLILGDVAALDAESGSLLWRQDVPDQILGLALGNGLVVATVDALPSYDWSAYPTGRIVALDAATGAERWTRKTPDRLSAPAVAGQIVYMTGEFGNMYSVNMATGEDAWRLKIGEGRSGDPIVAKGLLLVPIGDALYAFQ